MVYDSLAGGGGRKRCFRQAFRGKMRSVYYGELFLSTCSASPGSEHTLTPTSETPTAIQQELGTERRESCCHGNRSLFPDFCTSLCVLLESSGRKNMKATGGILDTVRPYSGLVSSFKSCCYLATAPASSPLHLSGDQLRFANLSFTFLSLLMLIAGTKHPRSSCLLWHFAVTLFCSSICDLPLGMTSELCGI